MENTINKEEKTNKLVVLFIYLSVFVNSFVFFKEPFEFYFGYLIYIVLMPVFIRRFGYNRNLLLLFLILLATGAFNILIGNNTAPLFFKVFAGLMLSYLFYDYVIQEFDFDLEKLFKWYLKGAYIVSIIGIIQFISFHTGFKFGYDYRWILNKWGVILGGNFGIRINSIFAEPTHLACVLSAAFFVSVYNLTRKNGYYFSRWQSIIVVLVYLLSFSSLGQTGIFLTVLFLAINFGLIRYILIAIPLGVLLFNILYKNVAEFRERYSSLVDLYSDGKFELGKTHGSSYILYNNYHVATENFKNNFLFGSGIGSHPIAFEKFSLAKNIKVYGFDLNSADANSMLLRLISETGLFGVLIFIVLILKCYVKRNESNESFHWIISNGILVMILLNLFRQGHYFLNGFPFFILIYYYNWISYKSYMVNNDQKAVSVKDELIS